MPKVCQVSEYCVQEQLPHLDSIYTLLLILQPYHFLSSIMNTPTTQYFETDGGKLAYDIGGSGPLVICSPAMGDFRDAFVPLATALRGSGYRVATVDLRGHGDSSTTFKRYGDEATADDLLALIDLLGASGEKAVLVGASLSGAAVTIAAGQRPDKVAGVVLLGAFLRPGGSKLLTKVFQLAMYRPLGPIIWKSYAPKLWAGLPFNDLTARVNKSVEMLAGPGRWTAFHATLSTDHNVVAPFLPKVKAPVLVVIGDRDPDWSDPLAEAEWVASNFKTSEPVFTVNGAAHAPMLERPEQVSPAVVAFVDKVRQNGGFN